MFESLSQRLQSAFSKLGKGGRLSESDVEEGLRMIRTALLGADVHIKVVRDLMARIREQAIGGKLIESVHPQHQVVKIVHDELLRVMGGDDFKPTLPGESVIPIQWATKGPTVILMAGLQGTGKTTTCAKLARFLKSKGRNPLLVAGDMQRPAAVDQLKVLGESLDIPVYFEASGRVPKICQRGVASAIENGQDVVILDTAGRLHVDAELMDEVTDVARQVKPHEIFLVLDAMTGQDAVNSAKAFDEALPLTGVVLTKLDGDSRGGAALSVRAVTGKPIRFVGTGEKTDALEPFYPDRLASRILGMGDVVSLVERAQETIDHKEAEAAAEKMFAGTFTMDDMLAQFEQIEKLGPLKQVLGMLPGVGNMLGDADIDEKPLKRMKAIIQSMTPSERAQPDLLDPARRRRVARGSGTSIEEVNRLVKGFRQMRGAFKKLGGQGGLRGKMMNRNMRKMKDEQLKELKRRGLSPQDLGYTPS